jgi:membrane-bound lytic murein transglycosylase
MGSFMPKSIKLMVVYGCFSAVFAVMAACSPRHHQAQPMSVSDLMDDRVTLDGVLMKCNRNVTSSRTDPDCLNARIAIERLAAQNENQPAREAKRQEDFERSREQLRALQDKQRQEQQSKTKVDVYHLPVMPVDQPPAPKDPQSPIVGQTTP